MTSVDKSPEQWNAEAAEPLEERDLDFAIAMHRTMYRVETGLLKLHVAHGESGLGPPFNPVFAAFLDEQYGSFPWSKALLFLRVRVCRQTHPQHWDRPEWRGSLCHQFVSLVIRHETSLDYARLQLGLADEGRARRDLNSCLLVIERRLEVVLADEKAKQALPARSPSEWMAPLHEHIAMPGLHAIECPQCNSFT